MYRKIKLLGGLTFASIFASCSSSEDSAAKQEQSQGQNIVILYENDAHCNIDGYVKLAGLRTAIADTASVAVVSCGDFLQGSTIATLSKGQYVVDVMKHLGYDAITIGNHEFDYKMPQLFKLLSYLGAPVTCVNLRNQTDGSYPYGSYVMKKMAGKKVAFVGVVTPTSVAMAEHAFYDDEGKLLYDLCADNTYALVQKAVDEARTEGADYVIVLSHLGEDTNDLNVDSHGLIRSTSGIDVVLDAHTHSTIPSDTVLNKLGKPVIISQTGIQFANIGKLQITADGQKSTQLIPLSDIAYADQAVQHAADSVKVLAEKDAQVKICTSDAAVSASDANGNSLVCKQETSIGDLVTDSFSDLTGAEFSIINGSSIRTGLPAGTCTYGDIISAVPYNNLVCMVEITGEQLKTLLASCTKSVPEENVNFPQVSGLKFTIDTNVKQVTDIMVENKNSGNFEPLDPERTYRLGTIDYDVAGGGLLGVLKNNKVIKRTGMTSFDCLTQYLKNTLNGHIDKKYAEPQGRITIK